MSPITDITIKLVAQAYLQLVALSPDHELLCYLNRVDARGFNYQDTFFDRYAPADQGLETALTHYYADLTAAADQDIRFPHFSQRDTIEIDLTD